MLSNIHSRLHRAQSFLFDYVVLATYILYIVAFLGLSVSAPQYLSKLDQFLKIYVSMFLVVRFNPFRDAVPFTELDKRIAFSAGMLLITSSFLTQLQFLNYFPFP
jgi:hypothetical protein